jgi:predicted Zn-dependent protease
VQNADRADRGTGPDTGPTQQHPHEPLDEWLRRELLSEYPAEGDTTRWPAAEVARVMARLESTRRDGPQLTANVLWIREITAFTLPGRYVYISRRLLERCASDDPVAFALAHEIAHHELGHLHGVDAAAATVSRGLPGVRAGRVALVMTALLIERRVHGPEKEAQADARALEMCVAAGYSGERCIHVFDIFEADALDRGDLDGVFGLEDALDPTVREHHAWLLDARIWAWERLRGYLPIRERKARLRALLSSMQKQPRSNDAHGP